MPHPKRISLAILLAAAQVTAQAAAFDIDFALNLERLATDGITLGEETGEDRLVESALELEVAVEYAINDQWLLFFTGTLFTESEAIETLGERQQDSGLERDELGIAYSFGDQYDARLALGRIEYSNDSEWWRWWDESLDSLSLEASYDDWEAMLAIAEEQARDTSVDDFIDPEQEGIRRFLLSIGWEFADQNSLTLYYLDQDDRSPGYTLEASVNPRKIDESDADLSWVGLSYLGSFDLDALGRFDIELHGARVSGRETLYDIEETDDGLAEVAESERYRVRGTASGALLSWRPAQARQLTLIAGKARASGDENLDDSTDRSFRPTGLQGDNESLGELFQVETSNLEVALLGFDWRLTQDTLLSLRRYHYRQRHASDELRDSVLETDPSGDSRALGQETDLVIKLESGKGSEWIIKLAEFEVGRAFANRPRETVNFVGIEFDVEF